MTTESRIASPAAETSSSFAFAKAVLLVTAIAGTLDIIAAHLHYWAASGQFPVRLLKVIAGGALGRERAMQGGGEMMALGLAFHFFISFAFTLLFFLLYPRIGALRKNVYGVAAGYALFVSIVMNYIVLRLSALPWSPPNFANKHTYIGCIVLMVVFGLPIVLGAARFYRRSRRQV